MLTAKANSDLVSLVLLPFFVDCVATDRQSFLTHCLCAWLSYHSVIRTHGRSRALWSRRLGGNLRLCVIPIVLTKKCPTLFQMSSAEVILPWVEGKWEVMVSFFLRESFTSHMSPYSLISFERLAWYVRSSIIYFYYLCHKMCTYYPIHTFPNLFFSSLPSLYLN